MGDRYWDGTLRRFVNSGDEAPPPVRLERSYPGPLEEAEHFQSDAESWNQILKAICATKGIEVPVGLLRKDPNEELRVLKVEHWMKKSSNGELDFTEGFLSALTARDPSSGRFLRILIAAHRAILGRKEGDE